MSFRTKAACKSYHNVVLWASNATTLYFVHKPRQEASAKGVDWLRSKTDLRQEGEICHGRTASAGRKQLVTDTS